MVAQKHSRSLESASFRGASSCLAVSGWTEVSRLLVAHSSPPLGKTGWLVCHLVDPMYRELYRESSIALLFRRQVCGHSITSYPGAFSVEGVLCQTFDLAKRSSQAGQHL